MPSELSSVICMSVEISSLESQGIFILLSFSLVQQSAGLLGLIFGEKAE